MNLKVRELQVFGEANGRRLLTRFKGRQGIIRTYLRTCQAPKQPPTFTKHSWTDDELGNVCVLPALDGLVAEPSH